MSEIMEILCGVPDSQCDKQCNNVDGDEINRIKVDLDDLLAPTRKEDMGNDVWSVFNVVQEKLIEGDFEYISGTKVRKARKVKNFKQDQKINKELFELALEYVN